MYLPRSRTNASIVCLVIRPELTSLYVKYVYGHWLARVIHITNTSSNGRTTIM